MSNTVTIPGVGSEKIIWLHPSWSSSSDRPSSAGCTRTRVLENEIAMRERERWANESEQANESESVGDLPSGCWPPLLVLYVSRAGVFRCRVVTKESGCQTGQLSRPLRCGRTRLLRESSDESSVQRVMAVQASHQHTDPQAKPSSSTSRRARAETNYGSKRRQRQGNDRECSAY